MEQKFITLGALTASTGANASLGQGQAVALAEAHVNAALRRAPYKGLTFSFIYGDSAGSGPVASTRAVEFRDQGIRGLVIDLSAPATAVAELNYDASPDNDFFFPMQCSSCASSTLNNPNATNANPVTQAALRNSLRWTFKATMSAELIAKALIRLLLLEGNNGDVNGDGIFKLGLFGTNDVSGTAFLADLQTFGNQLHPTNILFESILIPSTVNPSSYNYGADLARLADNMSASMVVEGFPDAIATYAVGASTAAIINAHRNGGYTINLIGSQILRVPAVIQNLGNAANGYGGVSHVETDDPVSGEAFNTAFEAATGGPAFFRDSYYYDNAFTLMLAGLAASSAVDDPSAITGEEIRQGLLSINDPNGEVIHAGEDGFVRAIDAISEGRAINYEGASGPMDYDANLSVRNRLVRFVAENGRYVDVPPKLDCVTNDDCLPES
ncbi:MAG: ABC transporter substrate-binding protein [Myxococcaceae bacterium]